jgi:hypothetical protein
MVINSSNMLINSHTAINSNRVNMVIKLIQFYVRLLQLQAIIPVHMLTLEMIKGIFFIKQFISQHLNALDRFVPKIRLRLFCVNSTCSTDKIAIINRHMLKLIIHKHRSKPIMLKLIINRFKLIINRQMPKPIMLKLIIHNLKLIIIHKHTLNLINRQRLKPTIRKPTLGLREGFLTELQIF